MHEKEVKGILSAQNGMNLYRGCTHGCIYCDSRSKCYQFDHDFCDIEVKSNALILLEQALSKKRKKCMISTGSMCDPYLPLEGQLNMSRRAAEIVLKHGFGLTVLTKSDLVLRDLDLFCEINKRTKCVLQMTLTTFDDNLCEILEPNVCPTSRRVEVLKTFSQHSIPTVVWICPILPFINDTEKNLLGVLNCCREAGVLGILYFGAGVTLREGDREYFYSQLDKHFPGLSEKYHKTYGFLYEVKSPQSAMLDKLVFDFAKKHGIMCGVTNVFNYLKAFEEKKAKQQSIFDIVE